MPDAPDEVSNNPFAIYGGVYAGVYGYPFPATPKVEAVCTCYMHDPLEPTVCKKHYPEE